MAQVPAGGKELVAHAKGPQDLSAQLSPWWCSRDLQERREKLKSFSLKNKKNKKSDLVTSQLFTPNFSSSRW